MEERREERKKTEKNHMKDIPESNNTHTYRKATKPMIVAPCMQQFSADDDDVTTFFTVFYGWVLLMRLPWANL
jgi:hypothetical protein